MILNSSNLKQFVALDDISINIITQN